jgi:eukaryotic-like serine/threonine-protein kinase
MTAAHINLPDPFPILDPLVDPPRPQPAPPATEPASARYEFTQTEFKKGGMATISLARDRKNQSMPVIIKTPRHDTDHSIKLNVEKLLQEADYLRAANHPNIVKFIDLFYDQERMPNLVVEYIDCGDLLSKFKTAPADEQSTVKWGVQILSALEYIHQSGFIHRDLNPGNIMVRGSGEIALIDFGTVKSSGYSSDTVFFKPGFVIPEVSAKGYADKRSDIYGVGSTMYYLLTCGRPGFIKERDVVSMLTEKGISQRTAKCIDQALQMDPNFRFQSADAMRRALTGG